jgi:hypothetical protein
MATCWTVPVGDVCYLCRHNRVCSLHRRGEAGRLTCIRYSFFSLMEAAVGSIWRS